MVEAARALSDDEKRGAAERILKLMPTYDAGLEAAIAEGIEDVRAGRVTDFGEFLGELEAEVRVEVSTQ